MPNRFTFYFISLFFETRFHEAQAVHKLTIQLRVSITSDPPEWWDRYSSPKCYRHDKGPWGVLKGDSMLHAGCYHCTAWTTGKTQQGAAPCLTFWFTLWPRNTAVAAHQRTQGWCHLLRYYSPLWFLFLIRLCNRREEQWFREGSLDGRTITKQADFSSSVSEIKRSHFWWFLSSFPSTILGGIKTLSLFWILRWEVLYSRGDRDTNLTVHSPR